MNRRNALIAAGAVTGVVLAGAAAVAANTSILNAADSGDVGNLSAAAVVNAMPTEPEPQVIDIYIDDEVTPNTAGPSTTTDATTADIAVAPRADPFASAQVFNVDDAGTIAIALSDDGLLLGEVVANEGWMWTTDAASPSTIVVTYSSGASTYVFTATLADDGTIDARVAQPIVRVVQAPAAPGSTSTSSNSSGAAGSPSDDEDRYDDDHDDDDHDDHDDDDHDDEDDDHDEREGGDDDD